MRTNLPYWQTLQEQEYFEHHRKYNGLTRFGTESYDKITEHTELNTSNEVVIIGCGYGRETIQIAPYVKHVYGVDVSDTILDKARVFAESNDVKNFTGVLAENWIYNTPMKVDLIFSIAVMQHLTKDLVRDYLCKSSIKLAKGGFLIFQFVEVFRGERDAILKLYEPNVNWGCDEITKAATDVGLIIQDIEVIPLGPGNKCYWLIAQGT